MEQTPIEMLIEFMNTYQLWTKNELHLKTIDEKLSELLAAEKERDKQIAAKAFTAGLDWRNGIIQHGAVHNPFPDKEEYLNSLTK